MLRRAAPLGALLLLPAAGLAQVPGGPAPASGSIAVLPGYTTAYQGGVSYLVSAMVSGPAGVPLEFGFEYVPTDYSPGSNAKIFWVGLQHPRGLPAEGLYAGARAGLLKGPFHDGALVDLHIGLRLGGRGIGVRVEPALLAGFDRSPFVGARMAAGLAWAF